AYRGGLHDRAALRLAQRLRGNVAASVTILHVIAPGQNAPSRETQDFLDLTFPQSAAQQGGVHFKVVAHADPARAIIDECTTGYDLAVVGLGSEGGLPERSFGFRSEYIAQHSPASLLIVRGVDLKPK
ncbi:MAG: universal stress protein, partial [Bdellovibrionota bacterium]